MNQKNKKITTYFVLFSLLLIGIIYAILQANLQINGTAKIGANTWDIHFDNIVVNENSVALSTGDSGAVIDPENNCKIDFEVTLSTPGDFYEFTVDVVNAGTIDGMIGELAKTIQVNNETVSSIPDYLDYSITYSDGMEILPNHGLNAGATETYLVRLEFKTDIEELPDATTVETILEPQYIQADSNVITVNHPISLYGVFQSNATSGGLVQEYFGSHKDSFSTNGLEKIYYWTASSDDNVNTILDKWNVIFGGFCWQMYRTTDTGGIKLLYNGVPAGGKCTATGTGQHIGASAFNTDCSSLSCVGYKYGAVYPPTSQKGSGWKYAPDVLYENGSYTLIAKDGYNVEVKNSTSGSDLQHHHYTCGSSSTIVCENVGYVYNSSSVSVFFITLSNGNKIEDAFNDMILNPTNETDSTIKTVIDTWFQNNMEAYTSKLEDTIFCNDRSISNLGGWDPSGDYIESRLKFKSFSIKDDLSCVRVTDQFSVNNNRAHLIYPVGLMTLSEANLLGSDNMRKAEEYYWVASPSYYRDTSAFMFYIVNGYMSEFNVSFSSSFGVGSGVRPVVSLKPGTKATGGDGTKNNPYIVE